MTENCASLSDRFCSERCQTASEAGAHPYAPCPLISAQPDDRLCAHCGWFVPSREALNGGTND